MARASTFKILLALSTVLGSPAAFATDVNVIGLFSGKAVVVINRGAPRTLRAGDTTAEGVKLISADSKGAVLEIDGKRQTLEMGQHFETASGGEGRNTVTLAPDSRGQYVTDGQVNGGHVRFLVDTGASTILLSAAQASRLGVDWRGGQRATGVVADGRRIPAYLVKLDSVSVGDITLFGVEAMVSETGGESALLGMTFLSRTEMRREGQNLTLTKRY